MESPAPQPPSSGADAADELRAEAPIETPIVAPPCLPVETAPETETQIDAQAAAIRVEPAAARCR